MDLRLAKTPPARLAKKKKQQKQGNEMTQQRVTRGGGLGQGQGQGQVSNRDRNNNCKQKMTRSSLLSGLPAC
jgi:hypothetical protein